MSFGGPAGQIALLERELIERRGWIDHDDFRQGLALATLLPGPEALKLVIFCGWRLHGTRGGLSAGLGFLLPSILILLALSFVFDAFGTLPVVAGAVAGLGSVVVALIAHALGRLAPRLISQRWLVAVAFVAAIAFIGLQASFLWIVCGALLAGVLHAVMRRPAAADEPSIWGRLHLLAGVSRWHGPRWLAGGVIGWGVSAMSLWALAGGADSMPLRVMRELTKVAVSAFGGAYPALAYAQTRFVDQLGWISPEQAAAGLALAETTPGPLVIVLQFFGFSAALQSPAPFAPALAAVLGSLAASIAIFLPSFVLMLGAAPFAGVLRRDPRIFDAMAAVTAVTLVAIVDVGWRFARAVLWSDGLPQWLLIAMATVALVLLFVRRLSLLWLVLGGAALGALRALLPV